MFQMCHSLSPRESLIYFLFYFEEYLLNNLLPVSVLFSCPVLMFHSICQCQFVCLNVSHTDLH